MTRTKRTVGPGETEGVRRRKKHREHSSPGKKRHTSESGGKASSRQGHDKAGSSTKRKKKKTKQRDSQRARSRSAPPPEKDSPKEERRRGAKRTVRAKQARIFRRKFARELRLSHLKPALCKATFYRRVMQCILSQQTNVSIVQGLAMKGILVACQQIVQDVFDHGKRIMEVQGKETLMDKHWQHAVFERRLVQSRRRIA